ncbi:hemerythrin [Glutamicibacter uratoxydans]|uniref:Hemerythrin n=1 Tax=Glutamicibacter uratoxydans TaxID=43667 RepID=A0A4Y4DMG0_GLUUR|nr:hemerythrin domain-containing protein [Glutamicibacter uratoxydans]GED06512.1 hemerythrin [Glutamicibacter uratoxydans]
MSAHSPELSDASLAEAFTREHHEIDAGIEEYLNSEENDAATRARPLLRVVDALRRHIYLEEEIVFPYLPQGMLQMPLMVMRREHGELWRRMDVLEESIRSASGDSATLGSDCQELLALLDNHNSKEEPIIYPHMDQSLGEEDQRRVAGLLAGGSLPEGWVCQDA